MDFYFFFVYQKNIVFLQTDKKRARKWNKLNTPYRLPKTNTASQQGV